MKRLLMAFLCLCLQYAAWGQAGSECSYWVDDDYASAKTVSMAASSWQSEIDVGNVTDGIHALHLQVRNSDGLTSSVVTRLFLKLAALTEHQVNGSCYCWFDGDYNSRRTVDFRHGVFMLDTDGLTDGLHTVYIQADGDTPSPAVAQIFLKLPEPSVNTADGSCYCWFDGDYNNRERVDYRQGVFMLGTTGLTDGIHTLNIQANGSTPMPTVTRLFVKLSEQTAYSTDGSYICWFDGDYTNRSTINANNGTFLLDIDGLTEGVHTVYVTANGSSQTPTVARLFVKLRNSEAVTFDGNCVCWFDDDYAGRQEVRVGDGILMLDANELTDGLHAVHVSSNNGHIPPVTKLFVKLSPLPTYTTNGTCYYWFDKNVVDVKSFQHEQGIAMLDVESLTEGLHTVSFRLDGNEAYPSTSALFLKLKNEDERLITGYEYWVNNESVGTKTQLSTPVTSTNVIGLLPVEQQSIRSNSFQFSIENDEPVMYAKNDIRFRFYTTKTNFADTLRHYVDYNVKQVVEDVVLLEPGIRQTTAKPTGNNIKWYKLVAEPGDSLQFRLDRAATVQLFAPSGEEVLNASGSDAVKWFGKHVRESGMYYLALHNTTATYGNTVSIDYNHIDKYAVLRQDVSVVGNGGFSSITFEGNGFRDLYSVDLFTEEGDTIHSSAIRHTSNDIVSLLFDFTDRRTCAYNAVFHFTTEDKCYQNMVMVENAKEIELTLDIKYPITFLRGTSTTYTITVTNRGNSTAFNVPMELYLSAGNTFDNIESVMFVDENGIEFNKIKLFDIDKDSLDTETLNFANDVFNDFKGLHAFVVNNDTIDRVSYGFTDQLITIPPNSSTTFFLTIKSNSTVDLKIRIPSDWLIVHSQRENLNSRKNLKKKNVLDRDWCCEKEGWECGASIVFNIAGMIPIAGCISGALDMWFYEIFEIACADGTDLNDKIGNFCNSFANSEKYKSFFNQGIGNIIACIVGKFLEKVAVLAKKIIPLKKASATAHINHRHAYDSFIAKQNEANLCNSKAQKAFNEGKYDLYKYWMEDYDKLMKEADELEKLSSSYWKEFKNIESQISSIESQIDNLKKELADIIGAITNAKKALDIKPECFKTWDKLKKDCPHNPNEKEGKSSPVNSMDPNEMYGYTAESGSKAVKDGLTDVYYRIQFENDTTFATAAAHDIYLADTLDATKFDLSTFKPTRIKIGEKSAELSGDKNFVITIDMRPGINAIAQVEGTYDEKKGIARWHISSLDPMTMEPTEYVSDGVLPVNTNGQGIGEVSYDISLKPGLAHGTTIGNRAGIVFDANDIIMTPTWTNVIDREQPASQVTDVQMLNDSTASVHIEATDELSGPWRYDVYVQYGEESAWFLAAQNVPIDKDANVKVYEGIDHGFYVVVTDSAGNVEQKAAAREYTFEVFGSQVDTNTKLQMGTGWNWISQNQQAALSVDAVKPKAQRILSQTDEVYKDERFGWTGDLQSLLPTEMYKVQMNEAAQLQLSGLLFNAAFRSIPLYEGWNWMGYPVAKTMTPAEALAKLEAEEGDALIGQDGLATFSDGQWTGTLTELNPGQGYMYRSASDKNLFLNATAQSSSRKANAQFSIHNEQLPDSWTVDKRKYPNVMGMVVCLYQNGNPVDDADDWLLGAFCGEECRGLAQTVGEQLMMNVYGQGGEKIVFYVMHRESGEILPVSESEEFRVDLVGSVHQPCVLNIGVLTGIDDIENPVWGGHQTIYDLQGRKVDDSQSTKGVYIVTDGRQNQTQKVVKR